MFLSYRAFLSFHVLLDFELPVRLYLVHLHRARGSNILSARSLFFVLLALCLSIARRVQIDLYLILYLSTVRHVLLALYFALCCRFVLCFQFALDGQLLLCVPFASCGFFVSVWIFVLLYLRLYPNYSPDVSPPLQQLLPLVAICPYLEEFWTFLASLMRLFCPFLLACPISVLRRFVPWLHLTIQLVQLFPIVSACQPHPYVWGLSVCSWASDLFFHLWQSGRQHHAYVGRVQDYTPVYRPTPRVPGYDKSLSRGTSR